MQRRNQDPELDQMVRPLRADVRRLSSTLGQVLAESGQTGLLADVERLRKAAIDLRGSRGSAAQERLRSVVEIVKDMDFDRAESVARAFTLYFQLVNLAEERHRVRILRLRARADSPVRDSLSSTIAELLSESGEDLLRNSLDRLEVRSVLTAHPTEARRRAVVDALGRIARLLEELDGELTRVPGSADLERQLLEQITILWRTAQLREERPTPLDEVRSVMSLFDETLFTLVPVLYRELERALAGLSSVRPYLQWCSWVAGDRDGNPTVTHDITEAALGIQAEHVLMGLEKAARRVGRSLTLAEDPANPEQVIHRLLDAGERHLGEPARGIRAQSPREPYRAALLLAAERLRATRKSIIGRYLSANDFIADLQLIQESLRGIGASRVAEGELQHLVWQAQTFGFHLASMELRQHSSIHRRVLSELVAGVESDAHRLDAIAAGRHVPDAAGGSELAGEVLATLRTMARLQARHGVESCRRYVVSFTQSPADVVAVLALARIAIPDGPPEVDVVPLFESQADLEAAPRILDGLLALPGWRSWLDRRHRRLEVMLGYSDATKDAGYLAANLALYHAQSELVAWARRNHVELTLFHGRGGAVGRGGGPAGRAIRSQAPGSVNGRFKATEQGEVIFARYGNPAIALRHLEQVTTAVLAASTSNHEEMLRRMEDRYSAASAHMAAASEAAYRSLVTAPGFAAFFAKVTPLNEISRLAIGSRPASRNAGPITDLEQLRAIPWVFAWAQNRCNLPGWFGLGTGLKAVADRDGLGYLRQMVAEWPFLASVVDNAEMSLAKADPMIAGLYLERGDRPDLVDRIREEYRLTRRMVLEVTEHDRLLAGHPILRLAVDLRNPYVDALSFLQVRFLGELEHLDPGDDRAKRLSSLVRLTVNGVAAGLQNTG